jgi:hypothetical protein
MFNLTHISSCVQVKHEVNVSHSFATTTITHFIQKTLQKCSTAISHYLFSVSLLYMFAKREKFTLVVNIHNTRAQSSCNDNTVFIRYVGYKLSEQVDTPSLLQVHRPSSANALSECIGLCRGKMRDHSANSIVIKMTDDAQLSLLACHRRRQFVVCIMDRLATIIFLFPHQLRS